jgi:DNA-binding SARP family transcriptional activator
MHGLRKSLSDEIRGNSPILHLAGTYQLNRDAGVGVDVAVFDSWMNEGDRNARAGDLPGAIACYVQAIQLYRGDLITSTNIDAVIERERLRARFLTALAHVADFNFSIREYTSCLRYAQQLLEHDACREDAHRLVMRCYMRQGQRAQSLRQYRLCEKILRAEFDTTPETSTTVLYEQVRLDPDSI